MLKVQDNMFATNLMEEITYLDLVTDAQAQALKGTSIRELTSDSIAVELKNINDPFLVYGRRTKTILLYAKDVVVLLGKIGTVHEWALKAGMGEVTYLHGDWRFENDFSRAMWTGANEGVIVHQCFSYLSEQKIPELTFIPSAGTTAEAGVENKTETKTAAPVEAPAAASVEEPAAAPAEPAAVEDVSVAEEAEVDDLMAGSPGRPLTLEDLERETRPTAATLRRIPDKQVKLGWDIDW